MEIVGAYACSHAGLLITRAHLAAPERKAAVYDAFAEMGRRIEAAKPDVIILVATDHVRVYPLSAVPQFTIGVSETARGIGDAGLPPREVPVHQELARSLLTGCIEEGVDLAYSEAMAIDHSFMTPLALALPGTRIPIVPIAQNCNAPPLPALGRSHEVGRKLGQALRRAPPGRAVIIGTGGLSHWVGPEEFREFMRQPAGSRLARQKDYPMTIGDTGHINEDFDRDFLALMCAGRAAEFIRDWDSDRIHVEAGNGAQEVRNWLLVAGAVGDAPGGEVLGYAAVPEWLTGTAVMRFK
jgi:2,3-dihydroxyphenylpropionate 1,2-dioxygenase